MKYYVVDAFAERVFEGNPAGVCVLESWLPDELMQTIAAENNLSETAFTVKEQTAGKDGSDRDVYRLRWFTPTDEIDLCGHATLATAYTLGRFIDTKADGFTFITRSGELTAMRRRDAAVADTFELNFPARPPKKVFVGEEVGDAEIDGVEPLQLRAKAAEALGIAPEAILEAHLSRDLVIVVPTEAEVRALAPDFGKLAAMPGLGFLVTAPATTAGFDFVSRAFFPKIGANEDPVCGSAHCTLVPYWVDRLGGKTHLIARQVSKRGGTLHCVLEGPRVRLAGSAVLYSEAEININ